MAFDFQDILLGAVKDLLVSLMVFALVCACVVWVGGFAFGFVGPVPRISEDLLDFFFEGFYLGLQWQITDIVPALISLVLLIGFIRTEQFLSLGVGTLAASEFWLIWYWHGSRSVINGLLLTGLSVGALLVGFLFYRIGCWRHDRQVDLIRREAQERLRLRKEQILRESMPPD